MPTKPRPIDLTEADAPLEATLAALHERERLARRRALRGLGAAALFTAPSMQALAACVVIPSETEGPYPGDGTNGPNVLTQSGIVRSDIRSSFGASGTTVATGTPLTFTLELVSTTSGCAPLAGYAVYAWHCDAQGRYSMYSQGATTQNYLRGVQVTDAHGRVTFTTIFPGAYSGRWPHVHFEVYPSLAQATSGRNAIRTSQLALPDAACRAVYAQSALYPGSLSNHNQTTLASDNIFGNDGGIYQLATTTGSVANGYAAELQVGIAAATTATAPDIDQFGLTGLWYEAASSGQGFVIEIFPDLIATGQGYLHGGWFTFDVAPAGGAEKGRWYTFSGAIATGGSSATLPIYRNIGGNFDAPPITDSDEVGTATISFLSCDAATFEYAMTDGSGLSGSIPLTRLTTNVTCTTTSARPTNADTALSGNWYDPSTSGQGFIVEVNPVVPIVFFAWYTYAVNGASLAGASGQRWFTAEGPFASGQRSIAMTLYETTGGVFDTPTPGAQATAAVGTATLAFSGCNDASLTFVFTGGSASGQSGTIALKRVAAVPPGCVA